MVLYKFCIIIIIIITVVVVVGGRYQFRMVAVYSNHDNRHGPNSQRVHLRGVDGGFPARIPQSSPTIVEVQSISTSSIYVKWQVNRTRIVALVGSVAQWLGRQSYAGGLSLMYA